MLRRLTHAVNAVCVDDAIRTDTVWLRVRVTGVLAVSLRARRTCKIKYVERICIEYVCANTLSARVCNMTELKNSMSYLSHEMIQNLLLLLQKPYFLFMCNAHCRHLASHAIFA